MAIVQLWITTEWCAEDPDGSACRGCGEPCYLNQWRLAMFANGVEINDDDCQEFVVCGSCYEAVFLERVE